MTVKVYLQDAYVKQFEAKAMSVKEDCVVLDKTAFYPGGGGQPNDEGYLEINGAKLTVTKVTQDGEEILHCVSGSPVQPSSTVLGSIDWDLRYLYMRHHTAVHVLSGVIWKLYSSMATGGQIYRDRARIDFDLEQLNQDIVATIEAKMNEVVTEARQVSARYISREEALQIPELIRTKPGRALVERLENVRVVEIGGFDAQADGGTHVANTMEIGVIKVLRTESKGKHNKRIEISVV